MGKKIIGYRSHYLRFKFPETWEILKQAGFKYDTLLAILIVQDSEMECAIRSSHSIEYTNRYIEILEIPLIIMDGTLFEHMKLDSRGSWRFR